MPLYIKDPEVDKLTAELINLTKTSKVDAVKAALRHEIAVARTSYRFENGSPRPSPWQRRRGRCSISITSN